MDTIYSWINKLRKDRQNEKLETRKFYRKIDLKKFTLKQNDGIVNTFVTSRERKN